MRTFIVCFLLVLTMGCAGPMKDWPNVQSGIKAAGPLITAVETYRNTYGKYPESVDMLGLPKNVIDELQDRRIRYFLRENGLTYSVGFYPRGGIPAFCSTGNDRNEKWNCMGK